MTVRGWIFGLALVAMGCQEEGIRVLRVPKPAPKRTFAIIVPRSDATWFLKLNGPGDAVAADAATFREFGTSIQFAEGDPPMRYSMPKDWRIDDSPAAKGGMFPRFVTFRTMNDSEVIVTKLGPEAGAVLPNVNRWRGEVNLNPIAESELAPLIESIEIGGAKATFVDVNGTPKAPGGR